MKTYVAYIRVSTARQGEHGVSLQEQRDAITRYAERQGLSVFRWFEERETAAKRGRPVFSAMLRLLRSGKATGVLIHKIDRSTRNMKDWAELGELIDGGVEVHFVNESIDLASRGGRLSADIQAVVAADYIRNLREETRKGFYGRLKQGLYPLPAPLGYQDVGAGKPKEFDPVRAPLVRRAFELYAAGTWRLEGLAEELYRLGLRNRRGGRVSLNGLSTMLNNPFYIGLIRLKASKEVFPGLHERLISKSLFDRVQLVLRGKVSARTQVHDFQFRRLLTCSGCHYALIGEMQKGHVYYRCHSRDCPITTIREEVVSSAVSAVLQPLHFDTEEQNILISKMREVRSDFVTQWEAETGATRLLLNQNHERLDRFTDAYIDGIIDKETFEGRKFKLLMEQKSLEEKLSQPTNLIAHRMEHFLELAGSAYLLNQIMVPSERRDLIRVVTSNRTVCAKNVDITLKTPFAEVANRHKYSNGSPRRGRHRTLDELLRKLIAWFTANPTESFDLPWTDLKYHTRPGDDAKVGDLAA